MRKVLALLLMLSVIAGFGTYAWAEPGTGDGDPAAETIQETYAVEEMEVSRKAAMLHDSNSAYADLTIKGLSVNGIPLYEIYRDDGKKKPLVIALHGITDEQCKDGMVPFGCRAALEGCCCVLMDAAGCGDSNIGPIDAVVSWMETVPEIDTVIRYYKTIPSVDAEHFGIMGFSTGGNIAFAYGAYGKYKPTLIISEKGTPDFATVSEDVLFTAYDHGKMDCPSVMTHEEIMDYAREHTPLNHPEAFLDICIYAGVGSSDVTVNPDGCAALKQALDEAGGTKHFIEIYSGSNHWGRLSESFNPSDVLREYLPVAE